jgi:exoribonuclease R
MDDDANIVDVRFCKSAIHSVASLTYDEAQAMLDDPARADRVAESVKLLNQLARRLRQRRIDEGALTLASPEVRFKLDSETQNPTDVSMYALKESNALVEEWMLLANITVSKKILRHFPTLGVLRRHQPPSREQFAPLMSAAAAVGARLDISSSKALADSLDACVRPDDPYFNKLLRIMATRCMMPAQYFCSGEIDKSQWHHYGLAAPVYTHFTSPIRRYADVIVHRLLAAAIGVISLPAVNADRTRQQELCSHMNRRHRAAQYAQRASVSLHTLLYFKSRPSKETAYVLSVSQEKIVVIVPRFGIEGTIQLPPVVKAFLTRHVAAVPSATSSTIAVTVHDAIKHTVAIEVRGGSDGEAGTRVWGVQVFQPLQVSIRVSESRGGSRNLVMRLVVDGCELVAEDDEGGEGGGDQKMDCATTTVDAARRQETKATGKRREPTPDPKGGGSARGGGGGGGGGGSGSKKAKR